TCFVRTSDTGAVQSIFGEQPRLSRTNTLPSPSSSSVPMINEAQIWCGNQSRPPPLWQPRRLAFYHRRSPHVAMDVVRLGFTAANEAPISRSIRLGPSWSGYATTLRGQCHPRHRFQDQHWLGLNPLALCVSASLIPDVESELNAKMVTV
ncbi:unnamed protein product, partial [Urochloa humidicola]